MELNDLFKALGRRTDKRPVVLEIDLARGVVTAPPDSPLAALRGLGSTTMESLREGLADAAEDERVAGLLVHVAPSNLRVAELEELGAMVADFTTHKPSIAWAQTFGELGNALPLYALASRAGQVWVQPSGEVNLAGALLEITLLKGLFNKVGIEPEFGQRMQYKTAADQFAAGEITDANREMTQRLADSVVDSLVADIASARNIPAERVRTALAESPLTPERACELGLVNRVGYRDEVYAHALDRWGAKPDDLSFVAHYHQHGQRSERARRALDRKAPVIGVVNVRGPIITGRGAPSGPLGGRTQAAGDVVDEHLRAALLDDRVKAVVLRIDSPGGSAVASDVIWRGVQRVRESGRPVVAVMGTVAASGGYYAAMGADKILAQPTTLTGSIGVLAGKLVTAGLMDKLDIVREAVSSGPRATFMAPNAPFSEEDWATLNTWLDRIYTDFTTKAAAGRRMELDDLLAVAKGRVWTGADAKQRNLIDDFGGTGDAIELAAGLAGIKADRAQLRPLGRGGLFDRIRPPENSNSPGAGAAVVPAGRGPEALLSRGIELLGWQDLFQVAGPLALPWRLELR